MMPELYVMLIWVGITGNMHAGAAGTIAGFASLEACNENKEIVREFYDGWLYKSTIKCVALNNKP